MAIEASADFCCHVGTNISTDFLLNFCCCKFAMVENIDDLLFALVVDDSPVASHSIIKLLWSPTIKHSNYNNQLDYKMEKDDF